MDGNDAFSPMVWKRTAFGVVVVVVVAGLVAPSPLAGQPQTSPDGNTTVAPGGNATAPSAACNYTQLYEDAAPSVVLISRQTGQGSGFVYQHLDDGTSYLVTNQHVLGDAGEVEVSFRRGETRTGTVVGTSASADLGVVRVNETPEYAAALETAPAVPAPGEKVAALGSPFGLRGTITHGIVSGTDRAVPTDRGFSIPDVIQTDAPINPGNSGGPLVTCDGEVVGVNTAGVPAARAENIGFAVSVALVDRVVPELVETGEYDFAFLGVRTAEVTPAHATAMDLENDSGVMVVETTEGGPAEGVLQGATETAVVDGRQMLVGGDVIVAIDGQQVRSGEDLAAFLATQASPGDEVTLTVIRDGERQTVTVTLGERPDPPAT